MKFQRLTLASLCILLSIESFAATVTAVRSWRAPDNTRIVLDLSEVVSFRQLFVSNKQLIIELDNTDIAVSTPSLPERIGLLQSLQFQPEANKQRLIINLVDEVRPHVFLLPANDKYKPRLVIDLFDKVTMMPSAPVVEEEPVDEANNGRSVIVAVDAGHGGEDSGAIGASGHYEKHVTLAIAKKLVSALRKTEGFKAYLIRDDDYFIPLLERRKIARNRYKADIFISIHADAALSPLAKGASVFALSRKGATSATSRFAQALAEKENKSDLIGGVDNQATGRDSQLTNILADMVVEGSMTQSLHMGNLILSELDEIGHLHSKRVEQAGFAVLKEPGMISVLVETGFISNPHEEAKLTNPDEQQKIAQSVLTGVKSFLQKYPMQKTYFAWRKEQRSNKQKNRALREVVAIPEPKVVVMTADKLIDVPSRPKVEATIQTLAEKDAAQLMNRPLVDNAAATPKLKTNTDKPHVAEDKEVKTNTSSVISTTKRPIVAATLPSSLDDFMAGVPKPSIKTEVKTVSAKPIVKDNKAALNPQKTVDSDIPKIKVTPKEEAKKPIEKPNKHIVTEGDSLSAIAVKYRLKLDDLKEWNHLSSDNALLGTTLRLSAPEPQKVNEKNSSTKDKSNNNQKPKSDVEKPSMKTRTHVVKVGDSLSDLAVHYGVSQQAIRDANKFKDDNVLLGQTLKIPTP
ncbi:MAG: N-acetylmuramoyl-L-alanine amidase [Agitococcus sp.]|nr:N-acetylmuramoyl-L-alanine amidase [Agitococcus sp.]